MDTDLHDIYRVEQAQQKDMPPEHLLSEQIARDLRKQWFFNLFAGLIGLVLLLTIAAALVLEYRPAPSEPIKISTKTPYIAAYTLPANEQWAVEYRQVAFQADSSEPPGPKKFSSKWVKNTAYHIIMGEQAFRLNNEDVAQDHFEEAIHTFPSITGLRRYLGAVYVKKQAFVKAAEQLEMALKEERSADVLNNLGAAYIGIGKYTEAEGLIKEALLQHPDSAGCYKNLALLYQKAGQTNEARTAFEKYFSLNPQDTSLLENYVNYLSNAGKIRDVIAFLDRLNGADPLASHLLRARAAAQNNDVERAVQALRETAKLRTPSQTITEMHKPEFEGISQTEPFETLIHQLELASVSLSTNLSMPVETDIKTNR